MALTVIMLRVSEACYKRTRSDMIPLKLFTDTSLGDKTIKRSKKIKYFAYPCWGEKWVVTEKRQEGSLVGASNILFFNCTCGTTVCFVVPTERCIFLLRTCLGVNYIKHTNETEKAIWLNESLYFDEFSVGKLSRNNEMKITVSRKVDNQ